MKISLILATLGRDRELVEFLDSLAGQTYRDFELIVIDQNIDGRIDAIVDGYTARLRVKHVKVGFTGTARARDHGIRFAEGDIAAFPDDDCAYERDVLEKVVAEFNRQNNLGVLVGGSYDFSKTRFSIGVNALEPRYFTQYSMMGVEFTHFFNLRVVNKADFYMDHDFGIGSKYSGAEGFELLYRLLRAGNKAFYTPQIRIYHADKDTYLLGKERIREYSLGVGAFIRKFANEGDPSMGYFMLRKMLVAPVAKMGLALMSLNFKKLGYHYNNLMGVWQGFRAYRD